VQQLSPAVAAALRETMALAGRGNLAGARAFAEEVLRREGSQGPVHALLGMICCRMGDLASGIGHLREALQTNPDDAVIAGNLITALVDGGRFAEAVEICTPERAGADPSARLWRVRGYALQQLEEHAAAAQAYEHVVAAAPDDFESWNNLGNARVSAEMFDTGIAALERAASLAPGNGPVHMNLAAGLSHSGNLERAADVLKGYTDIVRDDPTALTELTTILRLLSRSAETLATFDRLVALCPDNADILVQLGEEYSANQRPADAEPVFRQALTIDAKHRGAFARLALMLELMNRDAELPALLSQALAAGAEDDAVNFIRVLLCRREKRFEDGLHILEQLPRDIDPVRLSLLEGQFRDRLDDADGAFSAFVGMNEQGKLDPSQPELRAGRFRSALREDMAIVTPQWFAGWPDFHPSDTRPSPAFLVGFPRSGTTLLDTMLMGHPDVQVLEERPTIEKVEDQLGRVGGLADLDERLLTQARDTYFAEVAKHVDYRPGALLIDKSPLHMNKVPVIQRLFPDARFILALRHPCDVVLSCFITGFRLNNAMSNFLDLDTAAQLYDLSFAYWEKCRSVFPVKAHTIFYERMVEDSAAELRPLFDYLGLDWREEVLDHRRTATERGLISTASYAQVTEPIYRRATGRWTRYRAHLEPVLPVLRPWADRFGYTI